jgi:hypothetical protein
MTLHNRETGKPFVIEPYRITLVWLLPGQDGTLICWDRGNTTCSEGIDEMQALLEAEGLKFARIHYMYDDWADCLINTDKIRFLEAKEECTRIQVGDDYDGDILVDMPMEQVLNLLAAARR